MYCTGERSSHVRSPSNQIDPTLDGIGIESAEAPLRRLLNSSRDPRLFFNQLRFSLLGNHPVGPGSIINYCI